MGTNDDDNSEIAQLLQELSRKQRGGGGDEDAPSISARRLQEIAGGLLAEPHVFHAGQIVKHKFPKEGTLLNPDNNVKIVFMRYLEEPIEPVNACDLEELFSTAATLRLDCLVLMPKEGKACTFFYDSRYLEPAEAERTDA